MTGSGFSSFTTPGSYWQASRAPRYSLLFALPLLLFYQTLALLLSHGSRSVRNGADVILQSLFVALAGAWGPLLFMICLIGVGLWLVARDMQAHGSRLRARVFAGMLGESVLLALLFGLAVGGVTSGVLGLLQTLAVPLGGAGGARQLDSWTRLMVSLGAGIYEELLFRVVLVGALATAARALLGWRPLTAGVWATVLGAAIFSAFHYIGPYGDRLQLYSFLFRTIAGLFFSALYLTRGFGITAWTHALYDVSLLMLQ
jgi:CAAX prenyl protease-like protein